MLNRDKFESVATSGATGKTAIEWLVRFNHVADSPPVHSVVTEWLCTGMASAGNATALHFKGEALTYPELDRMSNRVANYLHGQGLEHGDRVGLCLDRSIEMIAALIGIIKAGAAYVPLDPDYPHDRLSMMKEDARLRLLLVHQCHVDRFDAHSDTLVIWEHVEEAIGRKPSSHPGIDIDPEDIAYVIFTSGSTGRPKGIAMPHRALSNLIEWQLERHTFKSAARVLQYSSISFDVSFQEITTTLASGGTLYLIGNDDRKDPRKLLEQLVSQRIERLFLPYVAMRSLVEAAHMIGTYPEILREVITAGEQLRVDDAVRAFFKRIEQSSLDNQYGPSETHVITAHLLEGDPLDWPDLPPIGAPLKNTSVYILDEKMRPVDVGAEGELHLAGRNLAHGYLHSEEITRKAFIPNPLGIPQRPVLYKTGDLGAFNSDGSISFLGRRDHQVKIRGHRVEPGEINNAASCFRGITHCLTHAVKNSDGILQLVAYFTVQRGEEVDQGALRRHLEDSLPDYMVPTFMIAIDEVPYTPSGKVDFKALPKPSINNSQYAGEECEYESETEGILADLWSKLLGLERIPRSAEFFELGGDSLRAVTLFLHIQQCFGIELPLSTLAHTSTIAGLAKLLDGEGGISDLSNYRSLQMLQRGTDEEIPLFLIHGGKGNVLVFSNFAHSLDPKQPVYALQWSGWDGGRGERSVPGMAQAYASEIQRFLEGRACRLGGNCIGGLIAIEVARLLSKNGVVIDGPLLIWDAPNLNSPFYRPQEPWGSKEQLAALERIKEALLNHTPEHARAAITTEPEMRPAGLVGLLHRLPYLRKMVQWSKAQCTGLLAFWFGLTGRKVPMELREHHCIKTMLSAVRRHVAHPYEGDMLYFRSHSVLGRDFGGIPGWWDDLYLGFDELCEGAFEAHVVGAKHHLVVDVPEIASIVRRMYK